MATSVKKKKRKKRLALSCGQFSTLASWAAEPGAQRLRKPRYVRAAM